MERRRNSKTKNLDTLMKKRQYRSNQGRTPRQQESNYKITMWSLIGLIITFILVWITQS